jgi:hypothetical protein
LSHHLRGLRRGWSRDYVGAPELDEPVRDLQPDKYGFLGLAGARRERDVACSNQGGGKEPAFEPTEDGSVVCAREGKLVTEFHQRGA